MGLIDVNKVLAELTLHEKIELLSGHDTWRTNAIERLSIPAITVRTCHQPVNKYILTCLSPQQTTDGPHGARGTSFFNGVCRLGSSPLTGVCFSC
jgi:beta-glucosidase